MAVLSGTAIAAFALAKNSQKSLPEQQEIVFLRMTATSAAPYQPHSLPPNLIQSLQIVLKSLFYDHH